MNIYHELLRKCEELSKAEAALQEIGMRNIGSNPEDRVKYDVAYHIAQHNYKRASSAYDECMVRYTDSLQKGCL